MKLIELTINESMSIYGGRPTLKTSFFYDVGWFIGAGIRKVENLFK